MCSSHQAPAVFGFSACPWSATSTEGSHGPQITWIWHLHALGRTSPWDPGPSDPRGVPRDQNFWRKIFLISSSNDHILCILKVCFVKIAVKLAKQAIFCIFLCNGQNDQIWVVFSRKLHFQPYKSKIFIKQHLIFVLWENFWDKNFGPKGHPWGHWGPYLRGM